MQVTLDDIEAAQDRLDDDAVVRQTPVETSRSLAAEADATVRLKMEHLQRTGSFKTRGAYNKLTQVVDSSREVDRVVAASAGNHAQGVALAATKTGLDSTVVMPRDAPQTKIDATREYGAQVVLHGDDFPTAMEHARGLVGETSVFVHAFDDPAIVAGQGTLGPEILSQVPEVETILVPIGGGGLIGGIATAVKALDPDVRVVGVQAADAATVPQSLDKGSPETIDSMQTIADGIATGGISELTYDLIEAHVDEVVTVTDTQIAESVLFLLERTKQMVEGAGAASVAAMCSDDVDVSGEVVVPLLCGGNLSMTDLQTVLTHGLSSRGQIVRLRVHIVDKPGELGHISDLIAGHGANIHDVQHVRSHPDLDVGDASLQFRIETSGAAQTERIVDDITGDGYSVRRMN